MSKNEIFSNSERPKWITRIGEAEGAHDTRVELIQYKETLNLMLESIGHDLESATPTIAATELYPKISRAISIVDDLTSDKDFDDVTFRGLKDELEILDFEMMRGMRENAVQEDNMKAEAIFGSSAVASEEHFVIIPPEWKENPQ